jgi:hypothetical protein
MKLKAFKLMSIVLAAGITTPVATLPFITNANIEEQVYVNEENQVPEIIGISTGYNALENRHEIYVYFETLESIDDDNTLSLNGNEIEKNLHYSIEDPSSGFVKVTIFKNGDSNLSANTDYRVRLTDNTDDTIYTETSIKT